MRCFKLSVSLFCIFGKRIFSFEGPFKNYITKFFCLGFASRYDNYLNLFHSFWAFQTTEVSGSNVFYSINISKLPNPSFPMTLSIENFPVSYFITEREKTQNIWAFIWIFLYIILFIRQNQISATGNLYCDTKIGPKI